MNLCLNFVLIVSFLLAFVLVAYASDENSEGELLLQEKILLDPVPPVDEHNAGPRPTTTTATNTATSTSPPSKCRWGEPCSSETKPTIASKSGSNESAPEQIIHQNLHHHPQTVPFLAKLPTASGPDKPRTMPEGFQVTARVFTSDDDGLAHFQDDNALADTPSLPYLDCGSMGTSTAPLNLDQVYFRSSISQSFLKHHQSQLLVNLSPSGLHMELNSGETRVFDAGAVILLEDTAGTKCKTVSGEELHVLLLTLPQTKATKTQRSGQQRRRRQQQQRQRRRGRQRQQSPPPPQREIREENCLLTAPAEPAVTPRRWILGGLGTAISLLLADWMGKVAPLWLSVGIGGTCFVVGGTWGIIQGGERVLDMIEGRGTTAMLPEEEVKCDVEVDLEQVVGWNNDGNDDNHQQT